jgi:hypothetical protein
VPVLSLPLVAGRKYLPRTPAPEGVANESILARTLPRAAPGGPREPCRGETRANPRPPRPAPGFHAQAARRIQDQARHSSALRANPFPEVTDLVCRLPLPTFFYRLEAVHLGDQMRIWVRSGVKVRFLSNAARIFKCCAGEPRTRQEPPRSSGPRPSLRVTRGSQGPRPLNQKRKLFPGPRPASPGRQRLAARPRLQGRATPHVQVLESLPDSLSPKLRAAHCAFRHIFLALS